MRFEPHPYQIDCLGRVLACANYYLALFMGAGKTVITLTAINRLMYELFEVQRVLVVAPLRVAEHTWGTEAAKWDHLGHLRVVKVLGSRDERLAALQCDADVWVINRENLPWLAKTVPWVWDMVVFDEADGLKDRASLRFRALKHVRDHVSRMLFLSGTPTPNSLMDLWSQIFLLDGGKRLYRTITAYRDEFFEPDQFNRRTGQVYSWKPKPGADVLIHARVADIMMSLKAEDVIDLPDRIDINVPVTLPDGAREQYRELARELVLMDTITAPTAAVLVNKLRQLASGAVYDENGEVVPIHEAKIEAMQDILRQADGPVLAFYDYEHSRTRLEALGAVGLDVEGWNAGRVPFMALHPGSAGHGLNLQGGGAIIVWFDLPWSLGLYQQANARLHRQGQTQTVRVYHLLAANTVEQYVAAVLVRKDADQRALLEAIRVGVAN